MKQYLPGLVIGIVVGAFGYGCLASHNERLANMSDNRLLQACENAHHLPQGQPLDVCFARLQESRDRAKAPQHNPFDEALSKNQRNPLDAAVEATKKQQDTSSQKTDPILAAYEGKQPSAQ